MMLHEPRRTDHDWAGENDGYPVKTTAEPAIRDVRAIEVVLEHSPDAVERLGWAIDFGENTGWAAWVGPDQFIGFHPTAAAAYKAVVDADD